MWLKENIIIHILTLIVNCDYWQSSDIKDYEDGRAEMTKNLFEAIKGNKYDILEEKSPTIIKTDMNTLSNIKGIRYKHINDERKEQFNSSGTLKSRFLEIFQVVNFNHVSCTSSTGLEGICLHEAKCKADGGSVSGSCADGYGVCCVNQYTCEDSTSATTSWFTNPGFPSASTERLSCSFTINKATDQVKQIRLDFLSFEMLPPTAGLCQQDQFVVSGQNVNSILPILCGINTGQHVYLEVSEGNGPIKLLIRTVSLENILFSIKVTQLTLADHLAAPTGCLQYFMDSEGFLESFNYKDLSEIATLRMPSYSISRLISQVCNTIQAITLSPLIKLDGFCLEWVHLTAEANGIKTITIINFCSVLCKKIGPCSISAVNLVNFTNNLNYAMCIRRTARSCSITYTSAGDMQIVNYDPDGLPVIPPNQAGVEIYNCPSDYLLISATRLCGNRFNDGSVLQDLSLDAPVTDTSAGPIVIWFRSDEEYVGRGFKLKYQQNGCITPDYK